MPSKFTKPQLRALEWLPADGSFSGKADRSISAALQSLEYCHRELIDGVFGDSGPRGGRMIRYRLTAMGIDARKKEFPDAE